VGQTFGLLNWTVFQIVWFV